MVNKTICALWAIFICILCLPSCSVNNINELPERYVYSEKDDIWSGHNLSDFPAPASDEDYILRQLQNTSLIIEGVITDIQIEENNPSSDNFATMLSTVAISEVWYGRVSDNELMVSHAFRQIDQGKYAPQKGDSVILFLTKLSTYDSYLISAVPSYETFYILNPPNDTLLPLYTFEMPSSFVGGTKEELRGAVKEILCNIADGKSRPLPTVDIAVDVITDKYVKKYERKQKWLSLFPWLSE